MRDPQARTSTDLVNRRFVADRPDALWVTDITQRRTQGGWVYCAIVLDVFARRVVGWSIADHLRTELVIDALDMARWRRQPTEGQTVVHSDHHTQGGFNWSSQHLDRGGADGQTSGVDEGVDGQVAGGAVASAGHRAQHPAPLLQQREADRQAMVRIAGRRMLDADDTQVAVNRWGC